MPSTRCLPNALAVTNAALPTALRLGDVPPSDRAGGERARRSQLAGWRGGAWHADVQAGSGSHERSYEAFGPGGGCARPKHLQLARHRHYSGEMGLCRSMNVVPTLNAVLVRFVPGWVRPCLFDRDQVQGLGSCQTPSVSSRHDLQSAPLGHQAPASTFRYGVGPVSPGRAGSFQRQWRPLRANGCDLRIIERIQDAAGTCTGRPLHQAVCDSRRAGTESLLLSPVRSLQSARASRVHGLPSRTCIGLPAGSCFVDSCSMP